MPLDGSLTELEVRAQIGLSISVWLRLYIFGSDDLAFSTFTHSHWHHASNDKTAAEVKSLVASKKQHGNIFRPRENVKKHIVKNRVMGMGSDVIWYDVSFQRAQDSF